MTEELQFDFSEWEVIDPSRSSGIYAEYYDKLVIFGLPEKDGAVLFGMTPAVFQALGEPEYVQFRHKGEFLAITPSGKEGFLVADRNNPIRRLNCRALTKELEIPGNAKLIFTASFPAEKVCLFNYTKPKLFG